MVGGGGPRASPREYFKFRPSENQLPVIFESSFGDLSSQEEPFPWHFFGKVELGYVRIGKNRVFPKV
jgi:hypothetical protein